MNKLKKIFEVSISEKPKEDTSMDSGLCLDCDWDGLLKDADMDYDWDEFKRQSIPCPICPKCGGGIDNYYMSNPDNYP